MRIRLRVDEVCFAERGAYVSFTELYQDAPDSLEYNVKVMIPEVEVRDWISLIGSEVHFERVRDVHRAGALPVPDQGGSQGPG